MAVCRGDLQLWSHINCCFYLTACFINRCFINRLFIPQEEPAAPALPRALWQWWGQIHTSKKNDKHNRKWKAAGEGSCVSAKQQPQETGSQVAGGHYKVRRQEGFVGRYCCPFRPIPGINTKKYDDTFFEMDAWHSIGTWQEALLCLSTKGCCGFFSLLQMSV